uniref:Small ribosomal subunit protein uS3m n=1 Tax=Clavulina sp. TaxID=1745192 RepID=A0A890JII6_9AGAM|nr:ribosomal protein S3 [Clavulina sp.]
MINNITKYFALNAQKSRGPLKMLGNVKLQFQEINNINKILTAFFKKFYILISKPVYSNTANGIKISILYFMPKTKKRFVKKFNYKLIRRRNRNKSRNNLISLRKSIIEKLYWKKLIKSVAVLSTDSLIAKRVKFTRSRVTFLVLLLSKLLNTNVQLELVRIKYIYHDSHILAQFLGINSRKHTYGKFKKLLWKIATIHPQGEELEATENTQSSTEIFNNDFSPVTVLRAFTIKISGRLAKQRVVPKKTVKTTYKGAISPNKNSILEEATYTGKNKKGAYSIRLWTSHGTRSNLPK